jgi:N-methylhydantoinase A
MTRALRVISVERGLDPRRFALVAFGGAGGMHACALAEELGMRVILVPRASGVLSALGLAISDLRRDYVAPLVAGLEELDAGALEEAYAALESRAAADLAGSACTRHADLRYRQQSFELTVAADDPGALAEAFHRAHVRRYGYEMRDEPVQLVAVRVVATVPVEKPVPREEPGSGHGPAGRRRANFDGEWMEVGVHRREQMGAGDRVEGPALVELPEATCVVRAGWSGEIDATGTLVLRRA